MPGTHQLCFNTDLRSALVVFVCLVFLRMSIIREVAQTYKAVVNLTHKQRATRLYRRSMRLLISWTGDRELYLSEAEKIRAAFDATKHLDPSSGLAARLLREGEEKAAEFVHPDPYTVPYMPGGSKFMRNPPLPLEAIFAEVGEIPPEYNFASQTVTCVQVPMSAEPEGPTKALVDVYTKEFK